MLLQFLEKVVITETSFEMFGSFLVFCSLFWKISGIIYVERAEVDSNAKIGNVTTTFTHDEKGNSIVNVTMCTFVTITKALLYLNIKVPANDLDREYRVNVLKTVIDVQKFTDGMQANLLLRPYIESLRRSLDFKIKFPFRPVS